MSSDTKLRLVAGMTYLRKCKEWVVLDCCCSKAFDYVALDGESLVFIYLDENNLLPEEPFLFQEIEKWRAEHPQYNFPTKIMIMAIILVNENKGSIKLAEY